MRIIRCKLRHKIYQSEGILKFGIFQVEEDSECNLYLSFKKYMNYGRHFDCWGFSFDLLHTTFLSIPGKVGSNKVLSLLHKYCMYRGNMAGMLCSFFSHVTNRILHVEYSPIPHYSCWFLAGKSALSALYNEK